MATKLVRTPRQEVKLRVPGPTGNAVVEAMGATPVTMPVPDLPQALSTHAVDGALIPWEIIPALQLYETTQYQIEGPDKARFGTTTFQVSMNKAKWEALPDDLKAVFDAHSARPGCADRRHLAGLGRRRHRARGRERQRARRLTPEMDAFNVKLAPVVDAWIEEHEGAFDSAALADAARKAMAAHQS